MRLASPVWLQSAGWPWGMAGSQRAGFLLSSGLQLLGGAKQMSQREMAGIAGGRLALDNEPLTLRHVLPPPLVLFGIVREGCLWRS